MKTPSPENVNMFRTLCAGMSFDEMCVFMAVLKEGQDECREMHLKSVNELIDVRNLLTEKDGIISEVTKECNDWKGKFNAINDKYKQLAQDYKHVSEEFARAQKARFGQSSEQTDIVANGSPVTVFEDESQTEDTGGDTNLQQAAGTGSGKSGSSKHRGGNGKTARDYSNMQRRVVYSYDIEQLRKICGDNYEIIGCNSTCVWVYIPASIVVLEIRRPSIAYGSGADRKALTCSSNPSLWPNSFVSPSLLSRILYERFSLCLTYYRIEQEFANLGARLGRQTMSNWVIRAAEEFFKPVWNYMKQRLLAMQYIQCDETTMQVINDGRKPGSKSYIWAHTSGEHSGEPPIILFWFELTRGTDHLREFFKGYKGHITCDAYVSYLLLESESEGAIIVCGCMMHMRRRFVNALTMAKRAKLAEDAVKALPEFKALDLIKKFYAADKRLKKLSPEERKEKRKKNVRPKVNAFYDYIESLDTNDPLMSETMKDAIQYAINQKDHLLRFLDDGYIPIDNGFVERAIRPLTTLRRNSLFCTSIEGAEATAIICSIVETAKANKVRVDCYLEYLLEMVPKILDQGGHYDDAAMAAMMPWSEEYRAYEKQHSMRQGCIPDVPLGPNLHNEPPKASGKPKPKEPAPGNMPSAA